MAFNLVMMVEMHDTYAHAHFDNLDLDARSKWVVGGKHSALNYLHN